jgi:hypothetical protein
MIVINHDDVENGIEMSALESIIFYEGFKHDNKPLCCTISANEASLETILYQIKKHKKDNQKRFRRGSEKILIVYEKKHPDNIIPFSDFLATALEIGGIADAATSNLKSAGLYIIYVCSNSELLKIPSKRIHPSLLNITGFRLWLFGKEPEFEKFRKAVKLTEAALYDCGWLSKSNHDEQKKELEKIIAQGALENKMTELINSVDSKERNEILELSKAPLNNIVLFTAAFFEGIRLTEFNRIVGLLAEELIYSGEPRVGDLGKNDLVYQWKVGGDEILAKCGVVQQMLGLGYSTYKFESNSRKQNAVDAFTSQFGLKIHKRLDTLVMAILLKDMSISDSFLNGIIQLAFAGARLDADKCLISTCTEIAEYLITAKLSSNELRTLFFRLVSFINKWTSNEECLRFIVQFYHKMRESPATRNILAALLTHTCTPSKYENLKELQSLLNAISVDEGLIKFKTTQLIGHNFYDQFDLLLLEIDKWHNDNNENTVSQSFAFAKCSLLLAFYERRFSVYEKGDLGYKVIKYLLQDVSEERIYILSSFICYKNKEVFNKVFTNVIRDQLENPKFLPKALLEEQYSLNAFILIQCYYLAKVIKEEDRNIDVTPEKFAEHLLSYICRDMKEKTRMLKSALIRSANEYNNNIQVITGREDQEIKRKKMLILKRDMSRLLIKMLG